MTNPETAMDKGNGPYTELIELLETARRLARTSHQSRSAWLDYRKARVAAEIVFDWLASGSAFNVTPSPTEPSPHGRE